MSWTAQDIRCKGDSHMYEQLLAHRDVKRTNEELERLHESTPSSIRRRLLATSVRLSARMGQAIHKMADECAERLQIGIPHELYVYASPQFNAACFKPEDDRLCVMFSSGLLEAFEGSELKFVVGHELGHHLYRHHDIPIGYILRGKTRPEPRLALQLFSWSRYAEISADRAGAFCAQDFNGVARSLFKLSSGLSGRTIEFHLDDFLEQVEAMQGEDAEPGRGSPTEDWFSTHPFSPLRVKALQAYEGSVFARDDGFDIEELESRVQSVMELMEPKLHRRGALKWPKRCADCSLRAVCWLPMQNGEISEPEKKILEDFFGQGAVSDKINVDALRADLDSRISQVAELATASQARQVLRDICLIARARDRRAKPKQVLLKQIAEGLSLRSTCVDQDLNDDYTPRLSGALHSEPCSGRE